jgi:hypothetical protein
MRFLLVILALLSLTTTATAQQKQGPSLPVAVENVTLTDLDRQPAGFDHLGQKHLMIFYVDPDAHRQNADFQAAIEADPSLLSPNIQAYAVLNLKDTFLPNWLVRSIAERRTKGQPAVNLADTGRTLSTAWGLGDCNNKFCILVISREGELVFFRAGEFTEQDKADFYDTVYKYK